MKIEDLLMIAIPIIVVVVVATKIVDVICKIASARSKKDIEIKNSINLLPVETPYNLFEMVAKESLRQNSPKRSQEDFLDFFIDHIQDDQSKLVNNILNLRLIEEEENQEYE